MKYLKGCFDCEEKRRKKEFMKDLYIILTGKPSGLPLWEFLELQGKEETLKWLEYIVNK